MLFDLRSRHRRRVVKAVYVFLALLIGVGLVGFGVGTGGNFGGIFNAASSGGGAGGQVSEQKALTKALKHAKADPKSAAAWAAVGNAAYTLSQLPANFVTGEGYTTPGFKVLAQLKAAWQHYLAVLPAQPNATFAGEVAYGFGSPPTGIADYVTAESAQEILAEAQGTYQAYESLAFYAYEAKEVARGDLALARAVALAPKSQKKTVQTALAPYRAQAVGATGASGASGATSSSSSTTSSTSTSTSSSSTTSSSTSSSHTTG